MERFNASIFDDEAKVDLLQSLLEKGEQVSEIAREFGVSRSCIDTQIRIRGWGGIRVASRRSSSVWDNEATVSSLRRLWGDGMSASRIACELGQGLTRNAVISKVHRLGLSHREQRGRASVSRRQKASGSKTWAQNIAHEHQKAHLEADHNCPP